VNDVADARDPDDYTASQIVGRDLRTSGSDGVIWQSVRFPEGQCIGAFWPDVVSIPVQGRHYSYHWDGSRVDYVRQHDTGRVLQVD